MALPRQSLGQQSIDARPRSATDGVRRARTAWPHSAGRGIFVCEDREEAEWIADNLNPALVPVDIWRFPSDGVRLVPSDHGFLAATTSIEPSRLELIEADRTPPTSTLTRVLRALRKKLAR